MAKKITVASDGISKKTTMEYDANEEHFVYKTEQKIDPIRDLAKSQRDFHRPGDLIGNTQKHWQKVGEIPAVLYHELLLKFGEPNSKLKKLAKKLKLKLVKLLSLS